MSASHTVLGCDPRPSPIPEPSLQATLTSIDDQNEGPNSIQQFGARTTPGPFTVNSNNINKTNIYIVKVTPQPGSDAPEAADIKEFENKLPEILPRYARTPSGVPRLQTRNSNFNKESKKTGAYSPSIGSKATTRTLRGSDPNIACVMSSWRFGFTHNNLQLPKSLPYYMQVYTKAISAELDDSLQAICLWSPYPNMSLAEELQEKHCTLGDVGIFNDRGNFEVFFNIFMSEEENREMNYRPPENFETFMLEYEGDLSYTNPIQEDLIQFSTKDFTKARGTNEETGHCSLIFESTRKPDSPGGAILALPEGYTKETLLKGVVHEISEYIQRHVESWYATSNYWNADNTLRHDALKLIRSSYKSPIWAAGVLPMDKYRPGIPPVNLEGPASDKSYRWNGAGAGDTIRVNHGSIKRDGKRIYYTIAVEVQSVLRNAPQKEKGFLSFRNKGMASKTSISAKMGGFMHRLSKLSISSHSDF